MKQSWKRSFILILASIMIILSCVQATIESTFVMPFWNNENVQKTKTATISENIVYSNLDYLAPEESLWTVEGNISSKQNIKAEKKHLSGQNLNIFVIAFAIALFLCIIYSIAIRLFRECTIFLYKIVAYIHLVDGKKG